MKKISIILSLLLIASSMSFAQNKKQNKSLDELNFTEERHDYGTLAHGADGTHQFKFSNTSDKPVVITNVKSACGCTVPSWSKEPIQPGKSGTITVAYNTNLVGVFNKTVQVFSSAKNSPTRLSISGTILPKAGNGPTKVLKGDNSTPVANRSSSQSKSLDQQGGESSQAGNTSFRKTATVNGKKRVEKKK